MAYHYAIGVDEMIIYDNDSIDDTRGILEPFVKSGIVQYNRWKLGTSVHVVLIYHSHTYAVVLRLKWSILLVLRPTSSSVARGSGRQRLIASGTSIRTFFPSTSAGAFLDALAEACVACIG